MDAWSAHSVMSNQALASEKIREGLQDILLEQAHLYEALRARGLFSHLRNLLNQSHRRCTKALFEF
jgi:hypothetical protein